MCIDKKRITCFRSFTFKILCTFIATCFHLFQFFKPHLYHVRYIYLSAFFEEKALCKIIFKDL